MMAVCAHDVIGIFLVVIVTSPAYANRPPFIENTKQWRVRENDPIGTLPKSTLSSDNVTLRAFDFEDDVITYKVKGEIAETYFTVDETTGVVKLRKPFDYEVDSMYTAKFVVSDNTNKVEMEVHIYVEDVNDNPPMFDRNYYEVNIPENKAIGYPVIQVRATDPDTGSGGVVRYSFQNGQIEGPFSIDSKSGLVRLRRRVDFEKTDFYRLKVKATDQDSTNPLSTIVQVTVNILDMQDMNPVFLNMPYDRTVSENSAQGTEIVCLTAQDGDRGQPNDIVYSIVDGNKDGTFMLDTAVGNLRIATRNLDRDIKGFNGIYSLTVKATELQKNGLLSRSPSYSETTFDITILDENDEIPRWERRNHRFSVREDAPTGTKLSVAGLHVEDHDQGINSEMTISIGGTHAASFAATPALVRGTGGISLVLMAPLDYEENKEIRLKIFANETVDSDHYDVCYIIIDIMNVNDNDPVFRKPLYSVNVSEDASVSSVLLRVIADDADEGFYGQVAYSISDPSRNFAIDPKSGNIHLIRELDRENIYQYSILVSAADKGSPSRRTTSAVLIHVTDVNDNAPQFDRNSYTERIIENEVSLKPVAVVRAMDRDALPFSDISYDIVDGKFHSHFKIVKSPEGLGLIYVVVPVDYEVLTNGEIKLTVVAIDSGAPPMNSTVPVVFTVTDVNDNPPEFLRDSTFLILVAENVGGGVSVGHVKAVDRDDSANARIRYYVLDEMNNFGDVFRLDEVSGDITIKPGMSPDHEKVSYYNVTIVAGDNGNPPLKAEHLLTVNIGDVNDNSPQFSQLKYVAEATEGTSAILLRVHATDKDKGDNGEIRYSIISGNEDGVFAIDYITGDVVAVKPVDYESSAGSYSLKIAATDRPVHEQSRSTTAEVIVNVKDVNDNSPEFVGVNPNQPVYYDVTEGVEGPRVVRFTARDQDSGENGIVTYSICDGNDKGLFSISHSEGDLRVHRGRELDREVDAFHNITICAKDSGKEPRTSSVKVIIRVLDTNDNPPYFTNFDPAVNISEDADVGSVVYQVSATDPDVSDEGKLRYDLMFGNDDDETFEINPWTGTITIQKRLDRESVPTYDLEIIVKDNLKFPQNSRSTTRVMRIFVTDVDDQTPRFVGDTPYRAQVDENSDPGTLLDVVGDPILAIDLDEGTNSDVTYDIIDEGVSFINNYIRHDITFFSIDPSTAAIAVQSRLDRESLDSDVINLLIKASDRDGHHSIAKVIVKVNDVNDNAPRFRSETVRAGVREDEEKGSKVTGLLARDNDDGVNGDVTYRIESGAYDKFTIEPNTGIIRVKGNQLLDREEMSSYSVIVVASDNGIVTSLSSTCTVTIDVEDVNDSRPKFNKHYEEVLISENISPNHVVAHIEATDDDLQPLLSYSIKSFSVYDAQGRQLVPGSDSRSSRRIRKSNYDVIRRWFHLDSSSGEIRISEHVKSHSVDREICSSVEISLMVRDLASEKAENEFALQSSVVKITIKDENDNAPTFMTSSPSGDVVPVGDEIIVDITEETPIDSVLVALEAIDPDVGTNGRVVYDVIEGSKVKMRDPDSGILVVASRIDRESLAPSGGDVWVNATVLARDLGIPESESTKLRVSIRVRDINDNPPKFSAKKFKVSVYEDEEVGSIIEMLKASDSDSGVYSDIVYGVRGGMDKFYIHPKKGSIKLLSELDRETNAEYHLTVTATDNERGAENDRKSTSVQLMIQVMDVNDCRPIFVEPRASQTYSVQENSKVGSFVAAVTATDPDDGVGGQISYTIQKSDISDFFKIQETTGHVTIRQGLTALPRHLAEQKLVIFATDGGGLHTNITIILDIVDVNDHVPLFREKDNQEISVLEEEPAGLVVGHVLATDSDSGLNGIVRYSFCDATNNEALDSFFIDEVSGRIITSRRLDREKRSDYSLYICANDLGVPRLQSSVLLMVRLLDSNDNEPEFRVTEKAGNGGGAWQDLSISEGARIGEVVGLVTEALDRDVNENARIYYDLAAVLSPQSPEHSGMFSVERESGRIILEEKIDREEIDRYILLISASNNGNLSKPLPLMTSSKENSQLIELENRATPAEVTSQYADQNLVVMMSESQSMPLYDPNHDKSLIRVVIAIEDVNDEWPVFVRSDYVTAVDMNVRIGSNVFKVEAKDDDVGNNSIVTYTVRRTVLRSRDNSSEDPVFGVFEIDPLDGSISTKRLLGPYIHGYFRLIVEASDQAGHKTAANVYIYILTTNHKVVFLIDNPPDVVREQENKFLELLSEITGARVILDDVEYHWIDQRKQDMKKSDVTIRVFDPKTLKEIDVETVQAKLEKNTRKLAQLFGDYSVKEIIPVYGGRSDGTYLRIIIVVMIFLFLILIIIFSAFYCHMRRRYKREIDDLTRGTLLHHDGKLESREKIVPTTSIFSEKGLNPPWKDEYCRQFEEEMQEDDEDDLTNDVKNVGIPIPVARKNRKHSHPQIKPRSRSENDNRLKDKAIPRTNTDIWVPQGGAKMHQEVSESLQQLMRERAKNKQTEKKYGRGERSFTDGGCSSSGESVIHIIRSRPCTTPNTRTTTAAQKPKEEKKKSKKEKLLTTKPTGRQSPELSLHSGGNSEDIVRKDSLHATDRSQEEDSDDITATNVTSSLTSSVSSVHLISDL